MKEGTKNMNTNVLEANYVHAENLPWVPTGLGGMVMKVCKANLVTGQYVLIVKSPADAAHLPVPAHFHHGTVIVYTIQGEWAYAEDDWVSGPGSVVYEPSGSKHRPVHVSTDEDVITFTVMEGALEILDANGKTIAISNAHEVYKRYLNYCEEHGIEPENVTEFE